jgi:hypothetical protein
LGKTFSIVSGHFRIGIKTLQGFGEDGGGFFHLLPTAHEQGFEGEAAHGGSERAMDGRAVANGRLQ